MNNQEYVKKIVSYIRSYMEQNNITQKKLESLCKEKDSAVSQGTISNIFAKPSSARLSTLINICDGLDISLSSLMKNIELSQKLPDPSSNLMIYDTSDPSYRGYFKKYFIYFLSTDEKNNANLFMVNLISKTVMLHLHVKHHWNSILANLIQTQIDHALNHTPEIW